MKAVFWETIKHCFWTQKRIQTFYGYLYIHRISESTSFKKLWIGFEYVHGTNEYGSTYFDTVVRFLIENGNVSPVELLDDLNHDLDLILIRRDGPGKVLEPLLVA